MPGSNTGVMPPGLQSPAAFPFTSNVFTEDFLAPAAQSPQAPAAAAGKQSGLGDELFAGGYRIGGDIRDVAVNGGPALIDVTGITQYAHSRIAGLRDGHMALTAFMSNSAAGEHAAFSPLPTADVILTYCRGQAIGAPAACLNAKEVAYDPARSNTGELTFKVQADGNAYGLEWGEQLTPGPRTDTGATNGLYLNDGAQTTFGAQAYLQATSFTGTDVTVAVQHAPDGTTWQSLLSFSQITGGTPSAQRVAVTGTVNQYVRAVTTTAGGFTSFAFQLTLCRNKTSTVF